MNYETSKDYLLALEHDPSLAIMSMQMVADLREVTRASIDRLLRLKRLEEIRIGKTRYVRASSLVALLRAEDQRVSDVRAVLEKLARRGKRSVFYEPVMAPVGLSSTVPNDRNIIGQILGDISRQTWNEHRIVLSVLVHQKKSGVTRPGKGFFDLTHYLDGFEPWSDEDALVERETQRVLDFYRKR